MRNNVRIVIIVRMLKNDGQQKTCSTSRCAKILTNTKLIILHNSQKILSSLKQAPKQNFIVKLFLNISLKTPMIFESILVANEIFVQKFVFNFFF